jgi:hypothetical protein
VTRAKGVEKTHERRVRDAGSLALNSLRGAARERVVLYWMNVHFDLVARDVLDQMERKRARGRR